MSVKLLKRAWCGTGRRASDVFCNSRPPYFVKLTFPDPDREVEVDYAGIKAGLLCKVCRLS